MDYDLQTLRALQGRLAPGGLQLKFVVTYDRAGRPKKSDLDRAALILKGLDKKRRPPVFFIPEAYAAGDYLKRCIALESLVCGLAKKLKGWDLRVQPQWHRVLYGDARGR
jgi:hypothetical protein